MNDLTLGTDCSGLGSPEEALKRLKVNYRVAFACDNDKFVKKSYEQNHSAEIFYKDVRTRDHANAPYVDMYVGGFPCQAFSISGKRLGFEDTRGTIFFNLLEYVAKHRPRVVIFENVKGIISHDRVPGSKSKYGRTFGVIRDALALTVNGQHNLYKYDDCVDYHVYFQILNTKHYGLPQNRERIFIVCFRDEADAVRFSFPKKIPLIKRLKDCLETEVDIKYYLSEETIKRLLANPKLEGLRENENTISGYKKDKKKSGASELVFHKEDAVEANTITTQYSHYVIENEQTIAVNDNGNLREVENVSCIDANYHKRLDNHAQRTYVVVGASRGRGASNEQHLEIRNDGVTNTITGVEKDNLIIDGSIVFIKDNTARGFSEAVEGDSINISNPNSKTRRGRVGKQIAQTLDTGCQQGVLVPLFGTEENRRATRVYDVNGIACTQTANGGGGEKTGLYFIGHKIRRLTPREVFRLFGYSDEFFERCASVNSDTQLYKQAGNSIPVHTFMHLLIQILTAIQIPFEYVKSF